MQKVDLILHGGIVLTMNEEFDAFPNGAVVIKGDIILDVGATDEIMAAYEAKDTLDCTGKILLPGLVNAHTHAAMTLLRGMADDLRLEVWLMGYIMPTEQRFVDAEFCRLGTLLACAEMIRSGVTLFNDMYYFEKDVAKATAEAGMRALCGQTVLKFPSPDSESWEKTFVYLEEFVQEWKDHPLIVPAIAPHAPYTCTDEILRKCADFAREHDIPLHIHIAETRFEVDRSLQEDDMTVLRRAEKVSVLDTKCICAHCVHLDSGEIKIAARKGVGIAHNPTSNLKLASGLAPIAEMLTEGCKVGIGTDGPASNNDLDMVQELHIASLIAKVQSGDPTALPARDALLMATRLGAAALHQDHLTGSLSAGKRADLIVLDDDPLHSTPQFNYDINSVYGRIVYSTKSTDIQHVMCNGKWLMQDRQLLTLDEAKIRADAQTKANEIEAFVRDLASNNFSKLVAIGGVERQESYELQVKARFDDLQHLKELLEHKNIKVQYHRIYAQYDTYFVFEGDNPARIRYREDEIRDEGRTTVTVRTRLTYTSPGKEREFGNVAVLTRSRFIAPATYPLRFYREYFKAPIELQVEKKRNRWHILYKGVEFYVNFDEMIRPGAGETFVEIKATTWSLSDAETKAKLLLEILGDVLHVEQTAIVREEYVDRALSG